MTDQERPGSAGAPGTHQGAQLLKGLAELALLSVLRGRPHYGLEILDRLRGEAGLGLAEGTIYPLLHRLERGRAHPRRVADRGRGRAAAQILRAHRQGPDRARRAIRGMAPDIRRPDRLPGQERGMTAAETHSVEDWLRRLKWALAGMPSPEREDIVEETRVHLQERIEAGQGPAEALAPFGDPEAYARGFIDEMELSGLLARPRFAGLLAATARRAHKSLVAALAFFAVIILGGLAVGVLITAGWKVFDPVHAGLWVSATAFHFGTIDDPSSARELLGNWIYPVALVIAALCWMLGRLVMIWAVRTIRRRR